MRVIKNLKNIIYLCNSYLVDNLRNTLHLIVPFTLLGMVGFPMFYLVMPKTEKLWLDIVCTLACGVVFVLKFKLKERHLVLIWLLFLMLVFPFNFSYNLLSNPHMSGYELGEMTMLITVFATISDTVLIVLLLGFGIGLAAGLFFIISGKIFIPTDLQVTLPWYMLGMILGLMLSSRRNRSVKEERINTKIIEQEKESLAYLSRKDSIKEAVLAIAHELNQPLTAVKIYTQASQRRLERLYGPDLSHEVRDALSKASEQAQRAGDIIHAMKDFLCNTDVNEESVNVNALIDNVVRLLTDSLREARVSLQIKLVDDLPSIKCNPTQLELVLVNLIKNSIESMLDASVEKRALIIRARQEQTDSDKLTISIEDSGTGISEDVVKRLFEPFVSTKENGVGLGLSLSYNIVQRHGGSISAKSLGDQGAIFTIMLPLE